MSHSWVIIILKAPSIHMLRFWLLSLELSVLIYKLHVQSLNTNLILQNCGIRKQVLAKFVTINFQYKLESCKIYSHRLHKIDQLKTFVQLKFWNVSFKWNVYVIKFNKWKLKLHLLGTLRIRLPPVVEGTYDKHTHKKRS
jgi:hypothetical protein